MRAISPFNAAVAAIALLAGLPSFSGDAGPTVFQISGRAMAEGVPRLGCNLDERPYSPGSAPLQNVWCADTSFEGRLLWSCGTVSGASGNNVTVKAQGPSASLSSMLKEDFWKGAKLDLFRTAASGGVEYAGEFRVLASKTESGGFESLSLDRGVPEGMSGGAYKLTLEAGPSSFERASGAVALLLENPSHVTRCTDMKKVAWSIEPSPEPPSGGGLRSLRVQVKEASKLSPEGVRQAHLKLDGLKSIAVSGRGFKTSLRLRLAEGAAPVKLRMRFGQISEWEFELGPEWTERTYDIGAKEIMQGAAPWAKDADDGWMSLEAFSPCVFLVDSWKVWRGDAPPFALLPEWEEALKEFKPGSLRLWSGYWIKSMDELLAAPQSSKGQCELRRGDGNLTGTLPWELEICERHGAEPWIVLQPFHSTGDLNALAEYLGAPPDVGMGRRRSFHGRPKPWVDAFKKIRIEVAHEAWNPACSPMAWPDAPWRYAQFVDYVGRSLDSSPYLKGKVEVVAGGDLSQTRRGSWTWQAAFGAKGGAGLAFANFTGGSDGLAFPAQQGTMEEWQSRLLHPAISQGRLFAQSLTLDPEGWAGLFAALSGDESAFNLLQPGLRTRNSRGGWPDNLLKPCGEGRPDAISELLAGDPDLTKADFTPLRQAVEGAFLSLFWDAMEAEPSLGAGISARLGVDEPAFKSLCAALKRESPRALRDLIRQKPFLGDALAGQGLKEADAKAVLKAKEGPEPPSASVQALSSKLAFDFIKGDSAQAGRLLAACGLEGAENSARLLLQGASSVASAYAEKRADMIAAGARRHPSFARQAFKSLAGGGFIQQFPKALSPVSGAFFLALQSELSKSALADLPKGFAEPALLKISMPAETVPYGDAGGRLLAVAALKALRGEGLSDCEKVWPGAVGGQCEAMIAEAVASRMSENAHVAELLCCGMSSPRAPKPFKGIYEFGPQYEMAALGKGFYLAQEKVNRSLAVGVACLDASLLADMHGFGTQNYYRLGAGGGYASHCVADAASGRLEPLAAWRLASLRNRHCSGDMMEVVALGARRLDFADSEGAVKRFDGSEYRRRFQGRAAVALEDCKAFKDGASWSALLINRSASEPRRAQLVIAGAGGAQAELRILDGPPDGQSLRERVSKAAFEGGRLSLEMPPCSVAIVKWRGN